MGESVRVAAVQDSPVLLDRDACIAQVEQLTSDAAAQGASLVVFPDVVRAPEQSARPRG